MAVGEAVFTEVRGEPLSGVVLRIVREAIVTGRLAPGEPINQAELSKQLGTSRAPLREALRQLEKEGLVTNVPYRGTIVTPLTARGVEELQAFRRLVEVSAAEQAIARATDADLDMLSVLLANMERCAEANDLDCMNTADISFHTHIIEMSRNDLLQDVWQSYVSRIRRALGLRNRVNRDLGSIVALHRDLLTAIRERDVVGVKHCYETHGADVVVALRPLFEANDLSTQNGVITR